MKKLHFLGLMLLGAGLLFTSCDKDEPKGDDGGGDGNGNGNGNGVETPAYTVKITPSDTCDLDSVYAIMKNNAGDEVIIGRAAYSNESFNIDVPGELDNSFLTNAFSNLAGTNDSIRATMTVNDVTVKMCKSYIEFKGVKDNKITGKLTYGTSGLTSVGVYYMYAENPFTLKGEIKSATSTTEFDVNMAKGWNTQLFTITLVPPKTVIANGELPSDLKWKYKAE